MPRPVQITYSLTPETPFLPTGTVPPIFMIGLGNSPANTNLLPIEGNATNHSPNFMNLGVLANPQSRTWTLGKTLSHSVDRTTVPITISSVPTGPVAVNRKFKITNTDGVDYSAFDFTILGRDANFRPLKEILTSPGADGTGENSSLLAYLDSISINTILPPTVGGSFELSYGENSQTSPINLDYFYPNTSYAFQVILNNPLTGGATYTVMGSVEKYILYDTFGIAYINPECVFEAVDASLTTQTTTSAIFQTNKMFSCVYLSVTDYTANHLGDKISFLVSQQGVR